jgi:hypothetical protein
MLMFQLSLWLLIFGRFWFLITLCWLISPD